MTFELPRSVTVDGTEYPVNYGFRAFIVIENCMFDKTLSDSQKYFHMLNVFFNENIPANIEEAFKQLTWFYLCGKEPIKSANTSSNKRMYAFEQDFDYIYAGFKTQYGIDLHEIDNMDLHWWKFRSMFNSLKDDLMISKIMGYRVTDLTGLSKEQKKHFKKMKDLYALHDDVNATSKMKLAERNKKMIDYVNKRFEGLYEKS